MVSRLCAEEILPAVLVAVGEDCILCSKSRLLPLEEKSKVP